MMQEAHLNPPHKYYQDYPLQQKGSHTRNLRLDLSHCTLGVLVLNMWNPSFHQILDLRRVVLKYPLTLLD